MSQETLHTAIQKGNCTLVDYSFRLLDKVTEIGKEADLGDADEFGGSITGAALLYLIKFGSESDFKEIHSLLEKHSVLKFECCRSGDLDVEKYSMLWVHAYTQASPSEQSHIRASLDIYASEGDDINHIISTIRMHDRMKKPKGNLALQLAKKRSSLIDNDKPPPKAIIPEKLLPSFHYFMIAILLVTVFCVSGFLLVYLYFQTSISTSQSLEETSILLWALFILGGLGGTSFTVFLHYKELE